MFGHKRLFLLGCLVLLAGSCCLKVFPAETEATQNSSVFQDGNQLRIVVSLSILGDWVTQIIGSSANVTSIVTGLEDVHTYEPSPSEIQAIAECDLFIWFGIPNLEPWVESYVSASPELLAKTLTIANYSAHEYMEYDPTISEYNGHIWMNPENAKLMVTKIYEQLAILNPSSNTSYYTHYQDYLSDIDSLIERIQEARSDLEGLKVVVHHPAFFYLFNMLGITQIGVIEESHEQEPSAEHIANLESAMLEEDCHLIVSQPQISEDVVTQIARDTNSEIAELTPLLGVDGVDTYIEMMDYNLWAIRNPSPLAETSTGTDFLLGIGLGVVIGAAVVGVSALLYLRTHKQVLHSYT